jgi:hypothetical protein
MLWWGRNGEQKPGLEGWQDSLRLACRWTIDRSMIKTQDHGLEDSSFRHLDRFTDWRGGFRGEYAAATRQWDIFCPSWHTGQAVKGLTLAFQVLGDEEYLDAAKMGADFLLRHRVADPSDEDYGCLYSYESGNEEINVSAMLEPLESLFLLSEVTGDARYQDAAIATLRWVQRKAFIPEEGLIRDDYDLATRRFTRAPWMRGEQFPQPGRPLIEDGVFILGGAVADDPTLTEVGICIADRLLRDEDPPGNWKAYPPADPVSGVIHPRHAYWWGRPMWRVFRATGERKYLDCCRRSALWYVSAMRVDGGLFRHTGPDFNTTSFGHATSGIECAAILWHDLIVEFGDTQWVEPLQRALGFCRSVQFTRARDENLQGAILEKVLAPHGSDEPPWYLRDVGTFFYLQIVSLMLRDRPELLP